MTNAASAQDPVTNAGEHGGPKGAYAGAEPTRYGTLTMPITSAQLHVTPGVHPSLLDGMHCPLVNSHTHHLLLPWSVLTMYFVCCDLPDVLMRFAGDWEKGGRCTDF